MDVLVSGLEHAYPARFLKKTVFWLAVGSERRGATELGREVKPMVSYIKLIRNKVSNTMEGLTTGNSSKLRFLYNSY